jgi:hypothetical protein
MCCCPVRLLPAAVEKTISTLGLGSNRVQPSLWRLVSLIGALPLIGVTHWCPVTHWCHSSVSLILCSGEDAGLSSATPSPFEQRVPSPGGAAGVPHSYLCVPVQFAQALPGAVEGQVAPAPASSAPGVCIPCGCPLQPTSVIPSPSPPPPALAGCVVARWHRRWAWTIRHPPTFLLSLIDPKCCCLGGY